MSALLTNKEQKILRQFIPLNSLSVAHFNSICDDVRVEEHAKGTVLFEQGDDAKEFIYLISGMISLYAGDMEMETVVTGSEAARFAIAHHLPRKVKAVSKSKVKLVRLPTHKLDIDSPKDDGQTYMVDDVEDQGGDWMTTMLQSPVFQRLPASNLQKVMMQMEEVAFEAGETVVNQGDEADYYYIIKSGDCELIRQASDRARPVKLAELHSCEAFGEDALLSGNPRNVTVKMKGRGQMLRLSKANFISLVKEPVLQYTSFDEGELKVSEGANWLDVRNADVYDEDHIDNSVNIPFFSLRMKISELRHDQLQVLVCSNGRTSEAAAFLLIKFGFNALILKGGMGARNKQLKQSSSSPAPTAKQAGSSAKKPVQVAQSPPLVSVGKETNRADIELREVAELRIKELEKLCAQSNEKMNAAELMRDELQQESNHKTLLLDELQSGLELIEEQHEASTKANTKLNATLVEAKEQQASLGVELERVQSELAQQSIELAGERDSSIGARQALESGKLAAAKLLESNQQLEAQERDALDTLEKKEVEVKQLNNQLSEFSFKVAELEETAKNSDALMVSKEQEFSVIHEETNAKIIQQKQEADSVVTELESQLESLSAQLKERSAKSDEWALKETELEQVINDNGLVMAAKLVEQDVLEKELQNQRQEVMSLQEKLGESSLATEQLQVNYEQESANLLAAQEESERLVKNAAEMEQQLMARNESLQLLQSDKKALEGDLKSALSALDENQGEMAKSASDLEEKLKIELAEKNVLQSELLTQQDLLTKSEANKVSLTEQVDEVKQQLDQLTKDSELDKRHLEVELEKAEEGLAVSKGVEREQLQRLEKETGDLGQEVTVLKKSLDSSQEAKASLEGQLDNLHADIANGLETQGALTQQLDVASQELNALSHRAEEAEALEKEVIELKKGLGASQQTKASLEEQLEELHADVANGLEIQGALTQQLDVASQELNALSHRAEEAEALEKEVSELKKSLDASQQTKASLDKQLEDLHVEVVNGLEAQGALTQQLDVGSQELNALSHRAEEADALEKEVSELKKSLDASQQTKASLDKQLEDLHVDVASGLEAQGALTQQLDMANQELDALSHQAEGERIKLADSLQEGTNQQGAYEQEITSLTVQVEKASEAIKQKELDQEGLAEALKQAQLNLEKNIKDHAGEKKELQQQLAQLKDEMLGDVTAQQLVIDQQAKAVIEMDAAAQADEAQQIASDESLQQMMAQVTELEAALEERTQKLSDSSTEYDKLVVSSGEDLRSSQTSVRQAEEKLQTSETNRELLQQMLEDKDGALTGLNGDQQAMLEKFGTLKIELEKSHQAVETKKQEFEEELGFLKAELLESKNAAQEGHEQNKELQETLDKLVFNSESDKGLVEKQLNEVNLEADQLRVDKEGLQQMVEQLEKTVSSSSSDRQQSTNELAELKKSQLEMVNAEQQAQQKVRDLEALCQQTQVEKMQAIDVAANEYSGQIEKLSKQLSLAQNKSEESLNQCKQLQTSTGLNEQEVMDLREQLASSETEKVALQASIETLEKKVTSTHDDATAEQQIKALETQLDEATSELMDLEIKLETVTTITPEKVTKEETGELEAVKSELQLVREQTEKDVHSMQSKLESSEKMNLALKKKLLSMQALANPEPITEDRKKHWWKK